MVKKRILLIPLVLGLQTLLGCSPAHPPSADGLRKSFYQNGQVESEKTYLHGKLSGPSRVYYENGQIAWEGRYINEKLEGPAKFFYDNGIIQAERLYADGVETGQAKLFSPQGTLIVLFNVEKGRKHGDATYFYQNGAPLKRETYVQGVKEGPETLFGRDGQVKAVRNYRNGVPIGAAITPPPSSTAVVAAIPAKKALPTPEELLKAAARIAAPSQEPAELAADKPSAAERIKEPQPVVTKPSLKPISPKNPEPSSNVKASAESPAPKPVQKDSTAS